MEVSRALAAAWTRWQRLHERHQSHRELGVAEAEAQFELVATGLVLSDEQVQKLFHGDAADVVSILTPLPTLESDEESYRRYHFALVAVGVLLDQFLQSNEASQKQAELLLKGNLTTNILLPVLQLDRHAALHHAVLSMFHRLLHLMMKREDSQEIIQQLFMQVNTLLTMETEDTVSYDSLCRLLEIVLRQDGELVGKSVEICEQATRSCRQQPKFLRAVVLHIVPVLLEKDEMGVYQRLLGVVLNAAESLQISNGSTFPQELLYLVCIIMPKAAQELIADVKLQKLVCFALRHDDSLLRKQGLHILKVAFSHCALLAQSQKLTAKDGFTWVDTWQNFLTASEVIQMHHEQHLIEQVWPQVENLLESYLIVNANSKVGHMNGQWPVQLTFDWMQSLLVRLFAHDNPVVKRLFISNFMESCVGAWQKWEKKRSACNGIGREISFACDPAFQRFVFEHLLRACNDPVLYKHAHRARFQAQVADFLSSFLAFQLAESDKDRVLDAYVAAMEEAIFGEGAENHSPEALLSMLQVFQSPSLKRAASSVSTKLLLSAFAVDRLRFLLDVHAMQSFSQAMRTKMLRALSHALTGGFVNVLTLSLSLLSRVLCVFPAGMLVANNGEALLQFLAWMKGPSSSSVLMSLSTALKEYLKPQGEGASENVLNPSQLARLLLFTAEMTSESDPHHLNERPGHRAKAEVVLRSPLSNLLPTILEGELESARLVLLVAKIEEQIQELVGSSSSQSFTLSFERDTFYDGQASCSYLFACAMAVVRRWLDTVSAAPIGGDVESDDHEKENLMEHVPPAVFVLSQMSTHTMNTTGELVQMNELDALCDELKNVLTKTADHSVFDLALAAKCLSVVGANAATLDSLRAFESERILPLLLALDTSRRYSGKLDARCAINLAASKWVLLHHVVESSSFIDTKLLRATYDACVEALPTAGMDPSALIDMVNVLSLTLSQLAGGLVKASDGMEQFEGLLEEVWTAYCDSKAKPDALTRAVVVCMFQPVFLLRAELKQTVKHWIAEFIRFGSQHRPNVIFHLACRLCQTWRVHPSSALSFTDELIELLLYKEPLIDEKEQLTTDTSAPFQGFQGFSPINNSQAPAITSHAKDRFVRLVMLSFLDDIAVDTSASTPDTQELMNSLLDRLLALNVTPDWQKQHMLNSDGFGKKLRSWQALCIVSAHVTKPQLTDLLPTLQIAFAVPQLPSVRYYMELFGMRMAAKFPREICSGVLLPMLRDANLMPQVGASMLLVSAYLANSKLDDMNLDINCGELLETMLPWLNTSHGYTRVLAQFLLAKVLPRHVHQLQLNSNDTPGLRFLEGTARYLSNNKECKRMLRRQARQLEEFHPDYESSLLGMLSSGFISEFGELLPRDEALRFSEQLKSAMNELYAQYQLENFKPLPAQEKSDAVSPDEKESTSGTLTVQRKIDTTALLLEDSALPAAMRANFDAARRGDTLNARQRPRQPLIMCASLVDKIPNLAGLARTCEIFNAQKLIVPNLRTTEKDASFATVSATAHKWMPLEEVRPHGNDLREALLRWKDEGYTIVAVEQTASSVSLANYTLPRKMVLVLGREKEGIPVDVLQLVDVCVEIPQFGLVRSLNVHVSGALMLWEYTQQQLMSGALKSSL